MEIPATGGRPPRRDLWIDHVRLLVIVLVVNMHACVTYSHVGGWYMMEGPEPPMAVKLAFALWQASLQSFFMGLLFFLAGHFAWQSLAKRGPGAFLWERLRRLGIPSLGFMLVLHPLTILVLLGKGKAVDGSANPLLPRYLEYLGSGRILGGSGPLWFALALLFFCAVLAVVVGLAFPGVNQRPAGGAGGTGAPPGPISLLGFGLGLVVTTFLVRLLFPIGSQWYNFQFCFFPQYIAAFVAGVMARRGGWLPALVESGWARRAGWLGVLGGPVGFGLLLWLGGPPAEGGPSSYDGGWHGQAFGLAAWEQLTGLCLGLGVMALFARRWNQAHPWLSWGSERAFGVYVLHTPILVGLTPVLRSLDPNLAWRVLVLTVLGLIVSFLASDLVRRVPWVRSVL